MKSHLRAFKVSVAVLFLALSLIAGGAHARGVVTFGGEFTFTNAVIQKGQTESGIVNNAEAVEFQKKMVSEALKTCDGCKRVIEENSYGVEVFKIVYPDGFYFVVATDPSVVEVQTKPLTNLDIQKNADRLARDVFGAAGRAGMTPGLGGGHIHFGFLAATSGDLLLTRNILVDFANHPELADGVIGNDMYNAPPLTSLPAESQIAFQKVIADVDAGKIRNVKKLVRRIQKEVYTYQKLGWAPFEKYQAVNVTRIASDDFEDRLKTFELRFMDSQKSEKEFEMQTRLFEGRLDFLAAQKQPIALNIPKSLSEVQKYDRFAKYVAESGIDLKDLLKVVTLRNPYQAGRMTAYPVIIQCRSALLGF